MKNLLYPFAFAITAFLILYSCSAEEEDTTPPPSVVATPEPEPEVSQFTLTVTAGEGGTVSSEGGTYDEGTEVTITATPNDGYEFLNWSGFNIPNTSNPLNLTVGSELNITANFIPSTDSLINLLNNIPQECEVFEYNSLMLTTDWYPYSSYEDDWKDYYENTYGTRPSEIIGVRIKFKNNPSFKDYIGIEERVHRFFELNGVYGETSMTIVYNADTSEAFEVIFKRGETNSPPFYEHKRISLENDNQSKFIEEISAELRDSYYNSYRKENILNLFEDEVSDGIYSHINLGESSVSENENCLSLDFGIIPSQDEPIGGYNLPVGYSGPRNYTPPDPINYFIVKDNLVTGHTGSRIGEVPDNLIFENAYGRTRTHKFILTGGGEFLVNRNAGTFVFDSIRKLGNKVLLFEHNDNRNLVRILERVNESSLPFSYTIDINDSDITGDSNTSSGGANQNDSSSSGGSSQNDSNTSEGSNQNSNNQGDNSRKNYCYENENGIIICENVDDDHLGTWVKIAGRDLDIRDNYVFVVRDNAEMRIIARDGINYAPFGLRDGSCPWYNDDASACTSIGVENGLSFVNVCTSYVTDMRYLFNSNGDPSDTRFDVNYSWYNWRIEKFDVSNVVDMSYMFYQNVTNPNNFVPVKKITDVNLGNWDVSNVRDMGGMFSNQDSFEGQGLENWDTSNVTNMARMFDNASLFNGSINNWDTSNVTNMSYMFSNARAFNQDIGAWNVSNVSSMREMFSNARAFNQDIGNWDVSRVERFSFMFEDAVNFNQDLSDWDFSSTDDTTDFVGMFYNCPADFDTSKWCVQHVCQGDNLVNPGFSRFMPVPKFCQPCD